MFDAISEVSYNPRRYNQVRPYFKKLNGRENLEDLGVYGRLMLKWIGFKCLWRRFSGRPMGPLWHPQMSGNFFPVHWHTSPYKQQTWSQDSNIIPSIDVCTHTPYGLPSHTPTTGYKKDVQVKLQTGTRTWRFRQVLHNVVASLGF